MITLEKSFVKTTFKAFLLTFGILILLFGLLNPITYFLGTETTASCDNATYTPLSNGTYLTELEYRYYNSTGKVFHGRTSFEGELDESVSLILHPVKYLPVLPFCSVFLTNYTLPLLSIVFMAAGLVLIIAGLFIKTAKKEPKVKTVLPDAPIYLCPACECEIEKDSIFCNYCGRKIIVKG